MPLVTNLIDDKSPLIEYDSTWQIGTAAENPTSCQYYHGTFTTNKVTNGQVTFTFNGTGIWWYGSRADDHGTFMVQIDQNTYGPYTGYSTVRQYMVTLFNITGLNQATHKVTLTNTGSGTTIWIVWQSNVGNDDDQLVTATIDDPDSRFQYEDSVWTLPTDVNLYNNGTGRYTEERASATLTFTSTYLLGEMVTLFGKIGTSNGSYTIQLDGGQANTYNALANLPYYGVTLFHADNLGSGLGIDYALVSNLLR
ncbi:hypothetical protein EDC04DRAFT_2872973 [Pisolithus marmoratus]|nr:hypothetical protein EDC04DRAFT_2872973 [Pisolithus marmoratus]